MRPVVGSQTFSLVLPDPDSVIKAGVASKKQEISSDLELKCESLNFCPFVEELQGWIDGAKLHKRTSRSVFWNPKQFFFSWWRKLKVGRFGRKHEITTTTTTTSYPPPSILDARDFNESCALIHKRAEPLLSSTLGDVSLLM